MRTSTRSLEPMSESDLHGEFRVHAHADARGGGGAGGLLRIGLEPMSEHDLPGNYRVHARTDARGGGEGGDSTWRRPRACSQ